MSKEIVEKFRISERITDIKPFGSGHINDTYCVCVNGIPAPSYLLQRVNTNVFPDIEKLSKNILRTTEHLVHKSTQFQVMRLIPSLDNTYWYRSDEGSTWRMLTFIPNSISFDLAPDRNFALQAGKAYGWFIRSMSDLPEPKLYEVIPGFHSLRLRIDQLNEAIRNNVAKRLQKCKDEVDFYLYQSEEMAKFDSLIGSTKIPLRNTHNDTKINNVLFDKDGTAISVIDLDTVMPGVVHYDFGDAIRTIAATALEDETNLEKIGINLELYKAFAEGFLGEVRTILTNEELEYLPVSPKIMAFIMGIRFLADYLRGDNYYKVKHPEHNIQRARNQMVLIQDMEHKNSMMNLI